VYGSLKKDVPKNISDTIENYEQMEIEAIVIGNTKAGKSTFINNMIQIKQFL
jgi:ribosome biogenesis GTPase A